ncbi:MAG: hypothetical protein SFV24_00670, partial [Gemmatimonadales bacterium]|nr:hypothetical protein [Gemmatimonadales bacterium]
MPVILGIPRESARPVQTAEGLRTNKHVSAVAGGERPLLWCFSANGDPFEPGKSYSKFAAFAALNHDDDFAAAALTPPNPTSPFRRLRPADYPGLVRPRATRPVETTGGAVSEYDPEPADQRRLVGRLAEPGGRRC